MLENFITETVYIFNEAAIYILFGFLIAGVLKETVPSEKIFSHLGEPKISSVLLASLLGIPLPLCSCAVLPTALSLKKQGASKGATLSFLISTPETGVDSISITYALIDPIMTIYRPAAALVTAVTAGLFANRFDKDEPAMNKTAAYGVIDTCGDSCGCEHGEKPPRGKMGRLVHYAFIELLDDIVFWLIFGIVIAGFISALVPESFFEQYLTGFTSMLIMLVISVPIYMCAASSTPIAAALILKGLNPGAALVFLLVGPATNVGTISAVGKFLGKRIMVIYLLTLTVASICLGVLLNTLYAYMNIDPSAVVGTASELIPPYIKMAGSFVLLLLIIRNLWKTGFKNAFHSLNNRLSDLTGISLLKKRKP